MQTIEIAAAIIVRNGAMLVVRKQGSRYFMQPGGKLEPGEAPEAALCRELAEELAIALTPAALSPLGQRAERAANEPDSRVVAHLFAVRTSEEPRIGAEIAEMAWLDLVRPPEVTLAPLSAGHVVPLARQLMADGAFAA